MFKSDTLELPDNVFKIDRVLTNSEYKFKFITKCFPKKIFEIRKSNYLEGDLYVGDLIFWNQGFEPAPVPKKLDWFIYADYLKDIGVDGVVKLDGFPTRIGEERWSLLKISTQFKNFIISELLRVKELSSNAKGILIALLTGDRSFLNKSTKDLFRDAGVVHVLAISGMHVGVLYLLLVFIFKTVFHFKGKSALFLIAIGLVFYAFLSGLSPSVIRATIMLLLIQFGTLLNSKTDTLNLVIAACWMMLVYEPMWLYDIGFQLSFSAVIGILVFLNRFDTWGIKGVFSFITDLLKVNSGAFLFTIPILSYHFQIINFTSWWASFIVVPFISLLMYGGIFGLFVLRFSLIKEVIFTGLNYFINFVEILVSFLVEFTSLQLHWKCSFLELLFYYSLMFSVLFKNEVLLLLALIFIIFTLYFPPSKEVKFLNLKTSIQIKVDNSCYMLKNGAVLQLNKYFFSLNLNEDKSWEVSIYKGCTDFLKNNDKPHVLTVDNYHNVKLEY